MGIPKTLVKVKGSPFFRRGAETFFVGRNRGARTFFVGRNRGARTFFVGRNWGARTFFAGRKEFPPIFKNTYLSQMAPLRHHQHPTSPKTGDGDICYFWTPDNIRRGP